MKAMPWITASHKCMILICLALWIGIHLHRQFHQLRQVIVRSSEQEQQQQPAAAAVALVSTGTPTLLWEKSGHLQLGTLSSKLQPSKHPSDLPNESSELLPGHFFPTCHMQANKVRIKSYQKERTDREQPHLSSILLTPSRYSSSDKLHWTAIFNLVPSLWRRGKPYNLDPRWANATWKCNGLPAIVVGGGCPEGTGFAIQCPQGEETRLYKVTAYPQNYTLAQQLTYRVKEHIACELDHPLRVPPRGTNIVGTAFIFGYLARSPHHLLEWIEYHRMVGVNHFYLYIVHEYTDDEWNLLPNLSYITYVPWNVLFISNPRARSEVLSFQISHQNDVLYRSRAAGVQWVTYNDIDEYIQIMGQRNNATPVFFENFLKKDSQLGSLMGLTIFFGAKERIDQAQQHVPDYLIEYDYRSVEPVRQARQKCFVRPGYVDYYNNHHVSLGNKTLFLKPNLHLRYNHYKNPRNGVTAKEIMHDSSLRDRFLDRVKVRVDEVKRMMIASNGGKIRPEWVLFDHLQ